MKIAIVVSQFNESINQGLLEGAKATLIENGVQEDSIRLYEAPGAFEMPLISQKIAESHQFDGVICLGSVIKGETAHFEYISQGASLGLVQAGLNTDIPISFGILTVYDRAQAEKRSAPGPENKGVEAANACLSSIQTLKKIQDELY